MHQVWNYERDSVFPGRRVGSRRGPRTGFGWTACPCTDSCWIVGSFAVDLVSGAVHDVAPTSEKVIHAAIRLGGAIVSTVTEVAELPEPGRETEDASLFWTDGAGTRRVGSLPGVPGPLHGPVAR
jgi:hypothetical protein